jgi:dynein heavy chain 2
MNISRATAPLAAWVKANVRYSEVLLKIEPLTSELNGLLHKLEKFQVRVQQCEMQLHELEVQTEKLNNNYQEKVEEAGVLKAGLKKATQTLSSAQNLLHQLSGENERWRSQVNTLQREMAMVPFKSLLSSACITYLGS